MTELAPGISQLNLGVANVYLIRGQGSLTLLDTGTQGSVKRLERHLTRRGLRWRDLDRIVVTHAHYDHAGGLAGVQAASGAEVWAHRLDSPCLRGEAAVPRPAMASLSVWARLAGSFLQGPMPPSVVHRELEDGERLPEVHPSATVVHLPGHSPGQIGLWFPEERVLLGGDVVTHFLPWRLTLPVAAYTPDMPLARASIRRVAALIGNASEHLKRLAAS